MNSTINKALEGIGGLFSDNKISTYIGVVTYAFPWLNLYVVRPIADGVRAHTLELVSGPDSTSVGGAVFSTYSIGSSVIVCTDTDNHGSMSLTGYIIGPASTADNEEDNYPDHYVAPTAGLRSLLSDIFNTIYTIGGSLYVKAKKKFLQPNDLLCGDTSIIGSPGNGISVLKHITRIHCGRGCFIELDSIMSRIRIVTEKMEYIGPLKSYQDMSGRGSLLECKQTAVSYEEGTLGLDDTDSKLSPVFRLKEVSGDVTTGWGTSISVPDINTGKSDDVYSSKVRYDGAVTMESAKGFEIKKTLNIVTPYLKTDPSGFSTIIKEVEDFPDLVNNYSKDDADALENKSLTMTEDAEARLASEFPRVSINSDTWGLSPDVRTDTLKEALESPRELNLIGKSQQYDLPDTITLEDPHTGKKYTYFKSESGFRQDPDGSLVLYDGYGSEIRMSRGNIIISSAADVTVRPGRDFHVMAGRHSATVAQEHVILHSSSKDVSIKGNKNVSLLSGINKDGKTIIDNRGAGVLTRSLTRASMVAPDIFAGSIPESSGSVPGIASKGSGKVVIGGGSSTVVTGTTISLYGEYIDTIAHKEGHVSWISMDTNRIVSISNSTYISGETYIGHISGTLQTQIGNVNLTAGNQNKKSYLYVQAGLDACYGINCRQVWAEQILGVRMYAGNASRESGIKSNVNKPSIQGDSPIMTQSNTPQVLYGGPWSDEFNLSVSFKYPSSAELNIEGESYTIPGMLWQKYLKDGKVWSEDPIHDIADTSNTSMVYPGYEAWQGVITTSATDSQPILGGYKING